MRFVALAAAAMICGLAVAPASAGTAGVSAAVLAKNATINSSMLETVEHRGPGWRHGGYGGWGYGGWGGPRGFGRCAAWRQECAARWGWRSPMWYKCLARHECL